MNEPKGIYISENNIAEYMYNQLTTEYGYTPTSDEILDLAEIVFDYIISLGSQVGIVEIDIELEEE